MSQQTWKIQLPNQGQIVFTFIASGVVRSGYPSGYQRTRVQKPSQGKPRKQSSGSGSNCIAGSRATFAFFQHCLTKIIKFEQQMPQHTDSVSPPNLLFFSSNCWRRCVERKYLSASMTHVYGRYPESAARGSGFVYVFFFNSEQSGWIVNLYLRVLCAAN